MNRIKIYTDGACSGNPGPGGACAIIINPSGRLELSNGFKKTTNNRMELLAVIIGLENVKDDIPITVYTDSKYVSDAINLRWLHQWTKNGWRLSNKKPVKNEDLWRKLVNLLLNRNITFQWVEGHSGIPENEQCDRLAQKALKNPQYIDEGYENSNNPLGL
jgi:ribonuclease HI